MLETTSRADVAESEIIGASTTTTSVCEQLLAKIAASFPAMSRGNCRLENAGGDYLVLVIDGIYAFRFPRAGTHDLSLEMEVLSQLRPGSSLKLPSYEFIDPAGQFAGYRYIEGIELSPARFVSLTAAAREYVLKEAAHFLSALHALPADAAAWSNTWPRMWTAADFAQRALRDRLSLISFHAPELGGPIRQFFDRYQHDRPEHLVIVHGDLVAEHMLLDPADRLVGIIDFSDVALGDPAQDFLGFWFYGEAAVKRVIEQYKRGGDACGLHRRSRNHYIRYRIDRLFEGMNTCADLDAHADITTIGSLLSAPQFSENKL